MSAIFHHVSPSKAAVIGLAAMVLTLLLPGTSSAALATLECIGTEWDAYGDLQSVFRLSNTSEHEVSYSGYSSLPMYSRQLRHSNEWRKERVSWCGAGSGTRWLAARRSTTFTVPLPSPEGRQTWRIGIEITERGRGGESQTVWSPPVTTDSRVTGKGPSADGLVHTGVTYHPDHKFPYTFTVENTSDKPLFFGGFREADVPPIYLDEEFRLERWADENDADWYGYKTKFQKPRPEGQNPFSIPAQNLDFVWRNGLRLSQEFRSGRWMDDGSPTWCGTGFGFQRLPPGGKISFSIPAQNSDAVWRIGLRFYCTPHPVNAADAYRPIWWPSLPPRDKS